MKLNTIWEELQDFAHILALLLWAWVALFGCIALREYPTLLLDDYIYKTTFGVWFLVIATGLVAYFTEAYFKGGKEKNNET